MYDTIIPATKHRRTLYTVAGRHWIERPEAYRDGRFIPIHERGYWSGWTIVDTGLALTDARRLARVAWYGEIAIRPGGRGAFGLR